MKNFPTAHKVKHHLKARAHAKAVKKADKKGLHQIHADNLYKMAHPTNAKRQKAFRRTLTHVVLPIALVISTATFAIGAEVVRNSSQKTAADAPPVPANSVCRTYGDSSGLSAQDSRIGISFNVQSNPTIATFSGLALNYLYAINAAGDVYNLSNVVNNKLNTTYSISYLKACAVNPGSAMPPFNSRAALVNQQYRDFFKRDATSAEQAKWASNNPATSKPYTAREILDWFVQNDAVKRGPLVRLYKAYYKRWPDAGGYDYWIRKMQNGTKLTAVSDYFAQSSEFKRNYVSLSNDEFVKLVYVNVLGRVGDQAGYNYWLNKLNAKKITRGGLMVQFSESSEFKRKYGLDCDLTGVTLRMLRRPATDAELQEWNPDETAETLASPIIFESAEYANRIVK